MEQLPLIVIASNVDGPERLANELRRRAGVGRGELVTGPQLAEAVLKTRVRVASGLRTQACLARVRGQYQVFIREVGPDTNFDVAHELGHYALREIDHYKGPDEERLANQIAAVLLAPRAVVEAAALEHGDGLRPLRPLARAARISQTAAHFRLGEVLEDGRVVVTSNHDHVLVRSTGAVDWRDVPIADVARRGRRWRGVVRAELRGGIDHGRIALWSA